MMHFVYLPPYTKGFVYRKKTNTIHKLFFGDPASHKPFVRQGVSLCNGLLHYFLNSKKQLEEAQAEWEATHKDSSAVQEKGDQ